VELLSQEIMTIAEPKKLELSSAMEALMVCHRDKWLRCAHRMVQNRADAEDIVQEAALRMLLRDRQFESLDQARMYMGRVISNSAIELYHLRRRLCALHHSLDESLISAPNRDQPEHLLVERERLYERSRMLGLLREGLASLPAKQLQALRLTIMDPDLNSIRDAGAASDIPYSTLRHRTVQGLRRLRRFLLRSSRQKLAKPGVA